MDSPKQSGADAQDQMSPSDIAALEKAFMEMLSSLDGSPAPPVQTATTTASAAKAAKPVAKAAKQGVGRLRASDIVFPSGDNIWDHSPSAKFVLDEKELKNFVMPQAIDDVAREEYARRARRSSKELINPADACVMTFGFPNGSSSTVFCDPPTRQFLRAHPVYRMPLFVEPHFSSIPVFISSVPNRGKGLFASHAIVEGERLFREPPLIVVALAFRPDIAQRFDALTTQAMPPLTQAALDELSNCRASDNDGLGSRWGIMNTNMFDIDFPGIPTAYGGCFQLLSRVNHSCKPNVIFTWDYKTFQGSLLAIRPIAAGEEVLLSYLAFTRKDSKAVRRAELQRCYRFKCTCEKCGPD